jgi:flagellar hook-basal body complex protein FliE
MNQGAIEAIAALSATQGPAAQAQAPAAAPGFATWMEQGLTGLNAQLVSAEQGVQKLASGSAENLHEVMLQLEQARLAMQVAAQVRSRVVEAYQDVMRMQV